MRGSAQFSHAAPLCAWDKHGFSTANSGQVGPRCETKVLDLRGNLRPSGVARGGVEPPTFRFSVGRSYQLSYLANKFGLPPN